MLSGVYYNLVRRGDNFYKRGCEILEKGCYQAELAVMFSEALHFYQKTIMDEEEHVGKNTTVLTRLAMAAFHCKEYKVMWDSIERVITLAPSKREGYLLKAGILLRMGYKPDTVLVLRRGLEQAGGDALLEECLDLVEDIQAATNTPLEAHHSESGWHAAGIVQFLQNYTRRPDSAASLARVLQSNVAATYLSMVLRVDLLDPASSYGDMANPEPSVGPLHFACWHGQVEAVVAHLSKFYESDIHEAGFFGLTPLHVACLRGHGEVVSVLLEYGAEPSWSDPGLNVEDFAVETGRDLWDRVVSTSSSHA